MHGATSPMPSSRMLVEVLLMLVCTSTMNLGMRVALGSEGWPEVVDWPMAVDLLDAAPRTPDPSWERSNLYWCNTSAAC